MSARADRPLLLLLGGASMPAGLDCMRQARRRGIDVCLADTPANLANTPEIVAAAAEVLPVSYTDVGSCVATATRRHRVRPFVGVYGFRELAVEAVAETARALALPGNDPADVRRVRDKAACRRALRERGFAQPAAATCTSAAQARAILARHRPGPWVVKPTDGKGSAGVSLVRTEADLGRALAHLATADDELSGELSGQGLAAPAGGGRRPFLVEEFQPGAEYSAEGVFVGGRPHVLAFTEKLTSGPPHFVEIGHAMPAELAAAERAAAETAVTRALHALGLRHGVFHVELWLHAGRAVLGEVHVRPGGDYIHVMTQHVTGVELHGAVFDQLLGSTPPYRNWRARRGAAVRFLVPPPGVATSVTGWDRVSRDGRFLAGRLTIAPGSRIPPLRSSMDRSSFVVATGRNRRDAVAAVERLLARIEVGVQVDVPTPTPPGPDGRGRRKEQV